jgi:hypothetical protein
MANLKKDASPAVIETLRTVEARADEAWRSLRIIGNPCDVAVWAMLTGGISVVEREQAARGSNTPHFDAMLANLSRLLPIAVKWAVGHGQPAAPPLQTNWTHELAAAVEQAIPVATAYSHFEVCFQAFHKNRYAVDVFSPTLLRFTTPGGERDRQVSAYQKGHRPREGSFTGQRAEQQPQTPAVEQAFGRVLRGCLQTGGRSFSYGDLWDLWRELLPEYRDRVNAVARRAGSLSVGPYSLGEFNEFYGAVIAICAAHDHLCYLWHQVTGVYPIESAIMVRAAADWRDVLSALSGISPAKCQAMISDLTFSGTPSVNLHVWPFIPLDPDNQTLALPPPFPLHSNHDENILRVCSQRRPTIYDATSLEKEGEMRAVLRDAGRRYGADGPIPLPHPVPDIDLIAADESSSTVVIAELKWIRKPLRPAEGADRDADVLKGVGQLGAIQQFLAQAPGHLSAQGKLPRPLDQYEHVYYLLVARDHWPWVEPRDRIAIVEFDTFRRALERTEDLHVTVSDLLRYEWLPVEGRDFFVQYDRATVNGVSIESQVFYSTHPA